MSKLLHCQLFIVLLSTLTFIPIADSTTDATSKPSSSGDVTSKTNENHEIKTVPGEIVEETTRNDENLEDSYRSDTEEKPSDDENVEENVEETTQSTEVFEEAPPMTEESTWLTIIKHYGYPFEGHTVETIDGYILQLHRIPHKVKDHPDNKNYPVLIPHGVGGSSADWVLAGPEGSLAMHLSAARYDVWLANSRGNPYSRTHRWKPTDSNGYWDFNLHELGTIDLPAIIEFIKKATKKTEIHYIGYSMGTCIFYIMASDPELIRYQKTIRSQISLAPVSTLNHAKSTVRMFVPIAKSLDKILSRIVGHSPASTSSKVVLHLSQLIRRGKFAKLSYGKTKNKKLYDNREPPLYDLESINVPITLIHAENDNLVRPKDVMKLAARLPMLMEVIKVPDKYFNHLDFLWNADVKVHINDVIIDILNKTDRPDWKYIKKVETPVETAVKT